MPFSLPPSSQLADAKKKSDEDQADLEELQAAKRKVDKELEALQERIEELTAESQKAYRSKKKLQEEVRLWWLACACVCVCVSLTISICISLWRRCVCIYRTNEWKFVCYSFCQLVHLTRTRYLFCCLLYVLYMYM